MKKILVILSVIFVVTLTSCNKSFEQISAPVKDPCPWEIGLMKASDPIFGLLSNERLIGSKVSISEGIKALTPASHRIDSSGRHVFTMKGFSLPAGSVGIVSSYKGNSRQKPGEFSLEFLDVEDREKTKAIFDWKLFEPKDIFPELVKLDDLSAQEQEEILSMNAAEEVQINFDKLGYIREGEYYAYRDAWGEIDWMKVEPDENYGKFKLSLLEESDINLVPQKMNVQVDEGFLTFEGNYLVKNKSTGDIIQFHPNDADVFLDRIKFKVCNEVEEIETPDFDDPIEKTTRKPSRN